LKPLYKLIENHFLTEGKILILDINNNSYFSDLEVLCFCTFITHFIMKKAIICIAVAINFVTMLYAQEIKIQDNNFKYALLNHYPVIDLDSNQSISYAEAAIVRVLNLNACGIADITGVENFTSLDSLFCNDNLLYRLPLNTFVDLKLLNCSNNNLSFLDLSDNHNLIKLYCGGNLFKDLNFSTNSELAILWCGNNLLSAIDVNNNPKLIFLSCSYNRISTLDISKNFQLEDLKCSWNNLNSLDISNNVKLKELYCYHNALTTLNISKNIFLNILNCYTNHITNLNLTENINLTELNCAQNLLSNINTYKNAKLITLVCNKNQLSMLDVNQNILLRKLYVDNNLVSNICLNSTQNESINDNVFKWEKDANTNWNICNENVINTSGEQHITSPELLKVYTIWGLEIPEINAKYGVYIYIYSDGSSRKHLN
jgi:hypothetical protein